MVVVGAFQAEGVFEAKQVLAKHDERYMPREITKAFTFDTFPFSAADKDGAEREMGFARGRKLDLFYATMTGYESGLPVHVAWARI